MLGLFYKAAGALVAPIRYAEREAKAFKENVKEDIQEYTQNLLRLAIIAFTGILFLVFTSVTVANAINNSMNSEVAGYAFVAGFYLLVAVVLYIIKTADDKKSKKLKAESKMMKAQS